MSNRVYDIVVYGATGYLGPEVCRRVGTASPGEFRWAIAGRNHAKLMKLSDRLQSEHPDLRSPSLEVATLEPEELDHLASKTRLLLNLAGPFSKQGTVVVEACLRQGAAYVDTAGEHTWTMQIATDLHEKAIARQVPIIPRCGVEASPPDLMTSLLFSKLHEQSLKPIGPVYFSIDQIWPGYSSSTATAILGAISTFSLSQINASSQPLALCVPEAGNISLPPIKSLPVRCDPFLGYLTLNMSAMTDRAVVMRTWSLLQRHGDLDTRYGEHFGFQGYQSARGLLHGWLTLLGQGIVMILALLLPSFRALLAWLAPPPGTGPVVKKEDGYFVEWKAMVDAQRDCKGTMAQNVCVEATMRVDVDAYTATAVLATEAALATVEVLADGESSCILAKLRGGVLTPASIGPTYLSRLERAGFQVDVSIEGLQAK